MPDTSRNDDLSHEQADHTSSDLADMPGLDDGSEVFIVRLWQQRRPSRVGGTLALPCRGTVEHLSTNARHYFLTWTELVQHLNRYLRCDDLAELGRWQKLQQWWSNRWRRS